MAYTPQKPPGVGARLLNVLTGGATGYATGMYDYDRNQRLAAENEMNMEADRQRAIQQDMLLRRRMEEDKQRRLLEQLAPYRVAPVTNQDGSINESASLAALKDAQDADDVKKNRQRRETDYEFDQQRRNDEYNFQLGARQRALGMDPARPQFQTGHSLSPGTIGKTISPEQAITEAEDAKKLAFTRRQEEERLDAYNKRAPAAVRNSEAVIDSMVASGAVTPDEAAEAKAVVQANGGRLPNLPAQYREDVSFNSAVLNAVGPLFKRIRDLGPQASSYFGPIDARLRSAKGSLIGGEDKFRAVEQATNEITSGRAFEQGGKALTATEIERIEKQIGKITDADFANRVEQYYSRAIRDAELVRERLMNDPARFSPEGQAAIQRLSKQIDDAKGMFGVASDAPSGQAANPADDILAKYGIK